MEIIIEPHTLERSKQRGASETEIIDVIKTGTSLIAKNNRLAKYKVFKFNNTWNNKTYSQKRIEVIFINENNKLITVTVYVFYGKWEEQL